MVNLATERFYQVGTLVFFWTYVRDFATGSYRKTPLPLLPPEPIDIVMFAEGAKHYDFAGV